jgi:hypothetical protein
LLDDCAASNTFGRITLSAWLVAGASCIATAAPAQPFAHADDLASRFANEVDRRLVLPPEEVAYYSERLQRALAVAGVRVDRTQFALLIDRSAPREERLAGCMRRSNARA